MSFIDYAPHFQLGLRSATATTGELYRQTIPGAAEINKTARRARRIVRPPAGRMAVPGMVDWDQR
jgi:hypothetical protein